MVMHAVRIAVTFALTIGCALATPPGRVAFEVNDTFPSDFLSIACGTDVFVHLEGTGTTSLYYDNKGNLFRHRMSVSVRRLRARPMPQVVGDVRDR